METTWVRGGRCGRGSARGRLVSLLCVVLSAGVYAYLPGGSREPAGGQASSVTLITGDRVHLQWRRPAGFRRRRAAPGREAISFARMSSTNASGQEDLSIVPADAQPLLANGLLDPALFNVTDLVRQGLTTPADSVRSKAQHGERGAADFR